MLSRDTIGFGSFLVYSPSGPSKLAQDSRTVTYRIKDDKHYKDEPIIEYTVRRLKERAPAELDDFFGPSVTVIPVPKSGLMQPGTLWVPLRICEALKAQGLAKDVLCCLQREKAVPKSAEGSSRPSPKEHYDSLGAKKGLFFPDHITLVDDVITRGSVSYASYFRVQEVFPKTPIRVFALVRTLRRDIELANIYSPCQGTITWHGGNSLTRDP